MNRLSHFASSLCPSELLANFVPDSPHSPHSTHSTLFKRSCLCLKLLLHFGLSFASSQTYSDRSLMRDCCSPDLSVMFSAEQPTVAQSQEEEPSPDDLPPIPEPYDKASERIRTGFCRVYRKCNQWPWELVPEIEPDKWAQNMIHKFAQAVEQVCRDDCERSVEDLVTWLKGQAANEKDGRLTHQLCSRAAQWALGIDPTMADPASPVSIQQGRLRHSRKRAADETPAPRPPPSAPRCTTNSASLEDTGCITVGLFETPNGYFTPNSAGRQVSTIDVSTIEVLRILGTDLYSRVSVHAHQDLKKREINTKNTLIAYSRPKKG